MDTPNIWERNYEKRRLHVRNQLYEQQEKRLEAATIATAYDAELESAICTLIPFIDLYTAELQSRGESTDEETTELLKTFIQLETLYLQLMKERKNNRARQTRRR